MKKLLRNFLPLLSVIVVQHSFAQHNSDCPGVPGACGFHPDNPTARTNSNQAPQDGSGSLGNTYSNTACGLNFTSASERLGQRFSPAGVPQPAPFIISGIPSCSPILKAFLWTEGSGDGSAQTATIAGPLGTANYPMTLVGSGPDKCWGYSGSHTYRADVTASVNGNGTYNISGLMVGSANDMDGATLLVIYADPTQTYQGTIIIDDGAIIINGGATSHTMTYPAVCGPASNAVAFCGVGDIQMAVSSLNLNGTPDPIVWNWWNFEQVSTSVSVGQTSSLFDINTGGDCFNFCINGLYYQTSCSVCTPISSLTGTGTSTAASCSANDGTATVTPSGGSGSYTYSWAPSGGTGATATGLAAGTYTCTITDAVSGCTGTVAVTVANSANLNATNTSANITCFGSANGSATVTPTGGSGVYTYSWAPSGGTGASATGLSAGSYTCTITDSNGCTTSQVVTITEPAALTSSPLQTDILCNGNNTGSASVVVNGGNGPYTYSWTPVGGTSATASGLVAGAYTCTITDANGCTLTQSFNITQPQALSTTITVVNAGCNSTTGSATANPTGGTSPYTYSWSSGGTGQTESSLNAGSYTVTITDANGCVTTQSCTISSFPAVTATSSSQNVTCFGTNTGSASVTASGGSGTFTYSWSPSGGTSATATGLAAGTYTCTITDSNGCQNTQTMTLTQPTALAVTSTGNAVCLGNSAQLTSTTSGGTSPYTYSWSNGATTASQSITVITTTTYTLTVTDANGCTTTSTATITINPVPTATITSNAVNGVFLLNGASSQLCFDGSTSGASAYLWDLNGTGSSTVSNPCVTVDPTNAGAYCATLYVTNSFNCLDTANVCIEIMNSYYFIPNVFTPNSDGNNDAFVISNSGMKELHCSIYNRWGELVYEWDGTSGSWNGQTKNGKDASDGVYYYTAHLVSYSDEVFNESGFVHLIKGN